jgi:MFS family permease
MFKALGKGFLDVFRNPLGILWGYILMFCLALGYVLIATFTLDTLPFDLTSNVFLAIIKNYFWMFLIFIAYYFLIAYLMSLFMAYVINKKQGEEKKTLGTTKIFGFTLFLGVISLLPSIIFSFFNASLTLSIIFMIIGLFFIFFLYPVLLMVPILLPKNDLKTSLSKSFEFAKENYGWIIVLEILFIIVTMIISSVFDYLVDYLTEFGSAAIFLLIYVFLFLWAIHFIYNWYYVKDLPKKDIKEVSDLKEVKKK